MVAVANLDHGATSSPSTARCDRLFAQHERERAARHLRPAVERPRRRRSTPRCITRMPSPGAPTASSSRWPQRRDRALQRPGARRSASKTLPHRRERHGSFMSGSITDRSEVVLKGRREPPGDGQRPARRHQAAGEGRHAGESPSDEGVRMAVRLLEDLADRDHHRRQPSRCSRSTRPCTPGSSFHHWAAN